MKSALLIATASFALTVCASAQTVSMSMMAANQTPDPVAVKPVLGTFGFDTTGMDRSIVPGNDMVRYANGAWAVATEIPADRSSYGMFTRLDDLSKERTRKIIEAAAATDAEAGGETQKIGDYFASFMDEATIEAKGAAPLKPDLDRIAAIRTKADLARTFAEELRVDGVSPFSYYVDQDAKNPDRYLPSFVQSGLGLPDRDYYLVDNPKFVETRAKYLTHIANMLQLVGVSATEAQAKAKGIYDLERQIAQVHWNQVDSRDAEKTYNIWKQADFARLAPGFDWATFFETAGLGQQIIFNVNQPSAFTGMAKIVASTPLAVWKDYLMLHVAKDRAPVLSKAFVDENFAFDGTVLSGQPQIQPRWKRGVNAVTNALGEAIGKIYVQQYFTPEAKAEADKLVRNIIAAMDERLANLSWMAPETRAKARAKLAAFTPKIGYPVKWRDYSALEIVPGDAYGNAQRASRFEYDRNLAKLGKPVDRDEWFMTPMTINAYANFTMNEIVFPAAILQPPFFDPHADPAVNYGGIGAVIGHEISHHFDDQGSKFDPQGRLADWWTPGDVERFKALTAQVVKQYSTYEPLPGGHVNGELTLGENIGDLAGITIAYDAYKKSLNGKPAPVIDGFTGDQRFFLGFEQIWRTKYREPELQRRLVTDPHTPGNFRGYVVRNIDAWYGAFDVKPGQAFYLSPEARAKIW